ncbi:MAG: DUF6484 domain-containing protein [Betaproteobacteria bacterium]|nr:DUF6484 domain-containing protein [Betaproteobacteria bacterium]
MTTMATKKQQKTKDSKGKLSCTLPPATALPIQTGHALLGKLIGLQPSGEPIIDVPDNPSFIGIPARSCISLQHSDIGKEVILLLTQENIPVVMGLMQSPHARQEVREVVFEPPAKNASKMPTRVLVDGRTVELNAQHEIVLRCGAASIKLTHEGKIVIRGKYVISHSSGANRVRGGSVELN